MATFSFEISILLLLLLSTTTALNTTKTSNNQTVHCNPKERETLLIFKEGIIDRHDRLSTWSTEKDCCNWKGVYCEKFPGRVTKVSMRGLDLEGVINLSILELEFLNKLDLSVNYFSEIIIPSFHHNLSYVSNIHLIDLSFNFKTPNNDRIQMDNLNWLSHLPSLKYLNLTNIDLHKEANWLQLTGMHPNLLDLSLCGCSLNYINTSLDYVNFTSLETLALSYNNFNSELPKRLFNFTRALSVLDFTSSNIHGEIPASLFNLRNLATLGLSGNYLKGPISDSIGQLGKLEYLYLASNMFFGSVPSTLGNLTSLRELDISSNFLSGAISETLFSKLHNLEYLSLRNSTFEFKFDPEWIPPFQLGTLHLSNTNLGPNIPSWILTQKSLSFLDLANTGIFLTGGNNFWNFAEGIEILFLSNNSMSGDISNVTLRSMYVHLSHNNFTGGLPHISPMTMTVDLSYNSFSGSLPHSWQNLESLNSIDLWSNQLNGEVLKYLSNSRDLVHINIGQNKFSGSIPSNMPLSIELIILRGNLLEGVIPPQLFSLPYLYHLDLANNKLSGSIPKGVYNLTSMTTSVKHYEYDLYYEMNLFTKGEEYDYTIKQSRQTIDFSANNLSGEIPKELFFLTSVTSLNLSHNGFSGSIPKMIGGMKNLESLDLSNNKLSGEIPDSMSLMNFLEYLDLSWNKLTGQIPIGTQLQSFNASSYFGNQELCGPPLQKCIKEGNQKNSKCPVEKEDDDTFKESLYIGMGVGIVVCLGGICCSLLFIRKWRQAYYRFLDGWSS